MPDIHHLLPIGAPPERVRAAIATAGGVRQWWTRDADLDEARGSFRFYGRERETRVAVNSAPGENAIRWEVTGSFRAEWLGTRLSFDLRPREAVTTLRFVHAGFAEADDRFAEVSTGWAYFLVSLKTYLERGAGAPSPDVDFASMIGGATRASQA